jgi:hypothetical protein
LICQDTCAKEKWQTNLTELNSWMLDRHTLPNIHMALIHNLHWWKLQLDSKTTSLSTSLGKALTLQTKIGWNNLVMGGLSNCWAPTLQHRYFQSLGKRTMGRSWATLLIVQLWQLLQNQWDHRNDINNNTMHPQNTE